MPPVDPVPPLLQNSFRYRPPFLTSTRRHKLSDRLNPEKILQTGLAFWASKTLLSAVEMGVFTELSHGPEYFDALSGRLGLHPRSARDFLDALVALGFLSRDGDQYGNTPETDLFLDRKKPSYVGGILEMANHRLYPFWGHLTEALRTGSPQNEVKTGGPGMFETLYADPARLKQFLAAMTGISHGANMTIARVVPVEGLPHVRRRGHRTGRSRGADCDREPTPERDRLRPARSGADLRRLRGVGRRRRPAPLPARKLLRARLCRRPTSS